MLASKIHHLRDLGLGDLVGEDAALPYPVMMAMQHDLGRGLDVFLEEFFQHENDEFHRRAIVVQDQHTVEARTFGLWLDPGDDGWGRTAPPAGAGRVSPF